MKELRNFQKECVSITDQRNGCVLIADEMGLGKTVESISWIQLHRELIRVIIICPASVKDNWKLEIEAWMNPIPNIQILSGENPGLIYGDVLIINYDIVDYWTSALIKFHSDILILDEAHFIKNNNAKRTKAVKKLSKNISHRIVLTGTPIENKPVEIWNAINIINPNLFASFIEFAQRYCNGRYGKGGWTFSGSSNIKELHDILVNSIMIRRLKKDVLPELPDKVYSFVPIPINNEKDYRNIENDFVSFAKQSERNMIHAFAKVAALKKLTIKGKLEGAISWIGEFLEVENKLVVFAHHRFVIDELMSRFKGIAVKIDGSVPISKRQSIIDNFQNYEEIKLIIISEAGGIGITLTSAYNMAVLELPLKPSTLDQIIDRIHRIGQRYSCNINFLLAKGTIDERIASIVDKKRLLVDAIIDGKDSEKESMIMELINSYNN